MALCVKFSLPHQYDILRLKEILDVDVDDDCPFAVRRKSSMQNLRTISRDHFLLLLSLAGLLQALRSCIIPAFVPLSKVLLKDVSPDIIFSLKEINIFCKL